MARGNVNLSGPRAPINLTTSGDHSLIVGTAGTVIAIYTLIIWASAAVTVVLKDGNSLQTPTAINGANGFNLSSQFLLPLYMDNNPLVMTPGNDFVINLGGNVNVNGWAYYSQNTVPTV